MKWWRNCWFNSALERILCRCSRNRKSHQINERVWSKNWNSFGMKLSWLCSWKQRGHSAFYWWWEVFCTAWCVWPVNFHWIDHTAKQLTILIFGGRSDSIDRTQIDTPVDFLAFCSVCAFLLLVVMGFWRSIKVNLEQSESALHSIQRQYLA